MAQSVAEGALPPAAARFAVGADTIVFGIGRDRFSLARCGRLGRRFGGNRLFRAAGALLRRGLGGFGFGFGFGDRRRFNRFGRRFGSLGGLRGCGGLGLARCALALRLFLGCRCVVGDRFGYLGFDRRSGFVRNCRFVGGIDRVGLFASASAPAAARLGVGRVGVGFGGRLCGCRVALALGFTIVLALGVAITGFAVVAAVGNFIAFLVAATAAATATPTATLAAFPDALAFLAIA